MLQDAAKFLKLMFLLFIVTVALSAVAAIKKNHHSFDRVMKKSIQVAKYAPNRKDIRTASRLRSFLEVLGKGRLNNYLLGKVIRDVKSNRTFSNMLPWLYRFKKIGSVADVYRFHRVCPRIMKLTVEKQFDKYMQKMASRSCINLFTSILLKKPQSVLYSKNVKFIQDNVESLLKGKEHRRIVSLLRKIKSKRRISRKLTDLFFNYYTSRNIQIPKSLLGYMPMSTALTDYVQKVGLSDRETTQVYLRELVYLGDELVASLAAVNKEQAYITAQAFEILHFIRNNRLSLQSEETSRQLLVLGKKLSAEGHNDFAREFFRQSRVFTRGKYRYESIFQSLWVYIKDNRYDSARHIIDNSRIMDDFEHYPSKLKFWLAYIYKQTGKSDEAHRLFLRLIEDDPTGFYSTVVVQKYPTEAIFNSWKINEEMDRAMLRKLSGLNLNNDYKKSLTRLMAWAELSLFSYVKLEAEDLLKDRKAFKKIPKSIDVAEYKKFLSFITLQALSISENYLSAFMFINKNLGRDVLSMNRTMLKKLYPTPYLKMVRKRIKKGRYDLSPYTVLGLIRQESGFDPQIRSRVGATGLMQLMPSTARMVRKGTTIRQLKRPHLNIRLGVKYLRQLKRKYDGNLIHTLAAYNAGEHRVDRWRKKYFKNRDFLKTIESIPFHETRNYVKYIYRNIYFYKMLDKGVPDRSDETRLYDLVLL